MKKRKINRERLKQEKREREIVCRKSQKEIFSGKGDYVLLIVSES